MAEIKLQSSNRPDGIPQHLKGGEKIEFVLIRTKVVLTYWG